MTDLGLFLQIKGIHLFKFPFLSRISLGTQLLAFGESPPI
jgi:hypothetical protein